MRGSVLVLFICTTLLCLCMCEENQEAYDPILLFHSLFKQRRQEHRTAVKRILAFGDYAKQFKMVSLLSTKLFTVLEKSRQILEGSGYTPGDGIPKNDTVRDALSNVLENTAFFGEVILKLPDVAYELMRDHNDWLVILKWSFGICEASHLLDANTSKFFSLVAQELGLVTKSSDFINPYRREEAMKAYAEQQTADIPNPKPTKKPKKKKQKGPRMSSGRSGEL